MGIPKVFKKFFAPKKLDSHPEKIEFLSYEALMTGPWKNVLGDVVELVDPFFTDILVTHEGDTLPTRISDISEIYEEFTYFGPYIPVPPKESE